MSKLTAIKKQIAALEAQAERIAKQEMSSAIAKVKEIMAEFNLTIEHLTQDVDSRRGAKRTTAKTKGASVAKYADPKTGKTWSGVGRAPGWIAGVKNRDAFLVDKGTSTGSAPKAPAPAGKAGAKAVKVARKAARPAAKKGPASAKKASSAKAAPLTAKKRKATRKVASKKAAQKRATPKRAAAATDAPAAPAAE